MGQLDRENGTLLSENTDLTKRVGTLDGVVNGLEAQNEGLSTTLSSLEERIGELKAEIDELESRRRALLVRSEVTEILCTGSMEPALTCLDSVTILTNFRPEDIVVGSIISFFEDGDTSTTPFLHRILERKVENGVNYFWPQGDAADEADGYWVPEDWVEGYVTELHKNSHPENTELRNEVLAKEDEYYRTQAHYEAVEDEVCGDISPGEICYTTDEEEDRLDSAYDAYLLSWCRYVAVLNSAELAGTGLARILPYECRGRV